MEWGNFGVVRSPRGKKANRPRNNLNGNPDEEKKSAYRAMYIRPYLLLKPDRKKSTGEETTGNQANASIRTATLGKKAEADISCTWGKKNLQPQRERINNP